jgi:hypothetical protein
MNAAENNVINLEDAKTKFALKQKEIQFKAYLRSLKREQLQYEANYLMNKAHDGLDDDTLLKSALLMEELATRVSTDSMSNTITNYADEIRNKADSFKNDN